jgi:putative transposase
MEAINCKELLQDTINIFTKCLLDNSIQISMDGRGRWADNIFIERLWRTIKYECIYLNDFNTVKECINILKEYIKFYNEKRPHQSLGGRTPFEIYNGINKNH